MSAALPEGYLPGDMRHFAPWGPLDRAQSALVGAALAAAGQALGRAEVADGLASADGGGGSGDHAKVISRPD